MQKRIIFDIETGPLSSGEIAAQMPEFEAPSNYRDAAKIAEVIESKKADFIERAALSPLTGNILAIGTKESGNNASFKIAPEKELLEQFWGLCSESASRGTLLAGFGISRFDIPFLVRRSWKHGVKIPACVYQGRYLNAGLFVDLAEVWSRGNSGEFISLKKLSEFLGVGTKDPEGGKLFHLILKTDIQKAKEYLENDLLITEACAELML